MSTWSPNDPNNEINKQLDRKTSEMYPNANAGTKTATAAQPTTATQPTYLAAQPASTAATGAATATQGTAPLGTTTAAAPKERRAVTGTDVGIRSALNNMGYSNDRIGFDGQYVTVDGNRMYQPDALEDGTSYASSQADLSKALVDMYAGQGKNIVKVTDYLANKQLPFDVSYNNGILSIGGITTTPLYVDNNYAYMDSGDLDRIIRQAQQASGIQNRQDVWQKYEDRYAPYYDQLIDDIVNREKFSYDPESDPAYQAYKLQYNREGDRAARDAAGAMAGLTGGYANSAAATAAAQQANYYAQQLTDQIPTLLQQAYERYVGDYDMTRQALQSVMGLDNNQYAREYGMNNDVIDDIRYNNALKTSRDDKAYERAWDEEARAYERAWNEEAREYNRRLDSQTDDLSVEQLRLANEAMELANKDAKFKNVLEASIYAGRWTDPEYLRSIGFDPSYTDPRNYEWWLTQLGYDLEDRNSKRLASYY